MKKKALRKDFYMEIRRSLGRFLSIFFIVAIGCAFFSGIRASEPDMRYSGDAYFDKKNLMDIQVISTLGMTKDDLDALKAVDGVENAEGRYTVDALCTEGDNQVVVHVMSLMPTMNQVQLEEGELPDAENECAVDVDFLAESSLEIGDQVTLMSGTDDEITDTLATDIFTITGAVSSPDYISFQRGSTNIGTGSVAGFICVPEQSFVLDVYTEIDVQAEDAKELTAFTDEYDDRVAEVLDNIEAVEGERCQIRYEEILADAERAIADGQQEIADAEKELEESREKARQELDDGRQQLENAQAELENGRTELEASKAQAEASRKELTERQGQLDQAAEQLNTEIDSLNIQIDQLNTVKEQYNELAASGKTDDVTMALLRELYSKIQEGEAAVAQAKSQIDSARGQMESAQQQINSGWDQLAAGEQEIADGLKQIESGEKELADKWEEYNKGEAEAKKEIADGESKIAEAKAELEDAREEMKTIEKPEWFINDRNSLPDYTGYGENADRMRAIGEVFPVIFFLVAALISLTTMTRMVEEQRTQIGTLKALGYERHSIAGKYLGYALLATVSGSVLGILFGEKVFPYIIVNAYGIMYQHMNELVLPYNLQYGLGAALAALASTLIATFLACFHELKEQAAELMRPPAPKQGQRVLLERIPIIWKHLNFSWKASVRNLARYKKRLFMTVFGIGGCMGLMLVGFGLKDSIFAIVDIQYGEIQLYDGTVIMQEDSSEEEQDAVLKSLKQDENVEDAAEGVLTQISVGSGDEWHDVYLSIPKDVESFPQFTVLQNRVTGKEYFLGDEGVVLTEKMAKELDVKPGDTIMLRDDGQSSQKVKVSSVCENYMGHYVFMTPKLYENLYGESPAYNSIFYRTEDRSTEEAERAGKDALKLPGTLSVSYTTDLKEQVDHMLGALDLVIVILIISAGMLAFVVLYNLNNIAITERKRELATLKVLGFYNNEITAYVYRENIVLTLMGAVFGMLLGWILHRFIIVTVEIDSVMFGRVIDPSSFLFSFLLTAAFSILVNGAMYFKLKKIDMVESLKSVE